MDLMEYQARELFEQAGLPVKKGVSADSVDALMELVESTPELTYPLVCKAQVQVGGRGKAGGIQIAANADALRRAAGQILGMNIKGHTVKRLMAVEKAEVSREFYLSIMLDRLSKCPLVIFSTSGGMEIEEVAKSDPEAVKKCPIHPLTGDVSALANRLAAEACLAGATAAQFVAVLKKLYDFFCSHDCLLAEINPLAIDTDGHILALDSKVTVDDSALYRQSEVFAFKAALSQQEHPLVLDAAAHNFLYIPCDRDGTVAVTSNGSGMLMSCIDRIHDQGMKVCAALDLGGGATGERIKEAVRIISSAENARAVLINIFGGITRCDEVAMGIRLAKTEYNIRLPIIVRFEGTNKEKGLQIIAGLDNVVFADGLIAGVDELVKRKELLV